MSGSIVKLESVSLKNVTGGLTPTVSPTALRITSELTFGIGFIFGVGALACQIQTMVNKSKAGKALLNGDKSKYDDLSTAVKKGEKAVVALSAVSLAAFATSAITYKINAPLRKVDALTESCCKDFELPEGFGL